MKIKIEFNNVSKKTLKVSFLKSVAERTLEKSGLFLVGKKIAISLAAVSEKEIKIINRTYRRKNTPTDVLSFSEYRNLAEIRKEKNKEIFLGEIIFCPEDIEKYCRLENISFKEEMTRTVSHGTLHLLGFRHGKKMFLIQNETARKVFGKK